MTTYHCILDNGKQHDVRDTAAGSAIFAALSKNPGHKVVKCWSGGGRIVCVRADRLRNSTPPTRSSEGRRAAPCRPTRNGRIFVSRICAGAGSRPSFGSAKLT